MLAYLSQNADKAIFESLAQRGFEIKALPPFPALARPTDTHADMLLLKVGDNVFKHKSYALEGDFLNIDEPIGKKYPCDVPLNILIVGNMAFCNEKHASKTVLAHLSSMGYSIHHAAQGYAHCSACAVSENAIITADRSIARAAELAGVDTLLISEGNISLPPYGYGFIGGASGSTDGAVYFCGSLKYHPDGERIKEFISRHGKEAVELANSPLSDIGGILFI